MRLGDLPIGARLLFRSRKDWRTAVIARRTEEVVTLSVASPKGYNYRIRREASVIVRFDGTLPFLRVDSGEHWKENFTRYDDRW